MKPNPDGSIELPADCSLGELDSALRAVQGRARTNRLDDQAADELAREVRAQLERVRDAARALGLELEQLQPAATWCPTTGPGGAGQHTQVHLRSWLGRALLRVCRGPVPTTMQFGVVTLHIPAARRQA